MLEVELVNGITCSRKLATKAFVRCIDTGRAGIYARLAARVCPISIEAEYARVDACVAV